MTSATTDRFQKLAVEESSDGAGSLHGRHCVRTWPNRATANDTSLRFPIAAVIVACTSFLIISAIVLVSSLAYRLAGANTTELLREKSELLIQSIDQRLQSHLEPVRIQLNYLAALIETGGIDLDRLDEVGHLLSASLAAVPQVSAVGFVTPDLRVVRAFRHRTETRLVVSDWSDDPGFQVAMARARDAEDAYWSELFVAENQGKSYLNLLMPLRVSGRYAGALIAGVSISELSDFVASLADAEIETAFILYDRAFVLAHPDLQEGYAGLTDAHPLPAVSEFRDEVLQTIWSSHRNADVERQFGTNIVARVTEYDDEQHVFLFRETDRYDNLPLLVGVYFPIDRIEPHLERVSRIGQFGLGVLLVSLVAALVMGRAIAKPVHRLAEAAEHIRRLDLRNTPWLNRSPLRELDDANGTFNGMVEALRQFEAYVPRRIVERLIECGDGRPLPPEERDVTIMFADIVGFTSLAETQTATQIADLLNQHFAAIECHIEAEKGTVDKYIGDALMAFWGAPDFQPDHADRACHAASAIAAAVNSANREKRRAGGMALRLRIGIHSGSVVVGNIGAPGRINYTVVGDAVNVAERIEMLSRELIEDEREVSVIISAATARRLSETVQTKPLGRHKVHGRHEPIEVFDLLCG